MAVPKKKTSKAKTRARRASNWSLSAPARSMCPQCGQVKVPHRGVRSLWPLWRPPGHRRRIISGMLPIAVDAMGGDYAPAEIVAGAQLAADAGIPVILVGQPDAIGETSLEVIAASEVVAMDEDPIKGGSYEKGFKPGARRRSSARRTRLGHDFGG